MSQSIQEQRTIFPSDIHHNTHSNARIIEQCNYESLGLCQFNGWDNDYPLGNTEKTVALFRIRWKAVDKSP